MKSSRNSKRKQRGEQHSLPMFHRSADRTVSNCPTQKRDALLDMLIKNGFAEVRTMKTDTFQGPRDASLLNVPGYAEAVLRG